MNCLDLLAQFAVQKTRKSFYCLGLVVTEIGAEMMMMIAGAGCARTSSSRQTRPLM